MSNEFFALEYMDEAEPRLKNVVIFPTKENGEIVEIGSGQGTLEITNAKSALNAASDFHRFKRYSHQWTTPGLHLFANSKVGEIYSTNLGVVSSRYEGNFPVPLPSLKEYPEGWAQVNSRNYKFYLSHFTNKDYAPEVRARKHDFVDMLVQGYGMRIRVLPFNGNHLADLIIASWQEPDDAKANAMRIEGFDRAQTRNTINRPLNELRKANGGTLPEMPVEPMNGGIVLQVIRGDKIDITTLQPCVIEVVNGKGTKVPMVWDGTYYAKVRFMEVERNNWKINIRK